MRLFKAPAFWLGILIVGAAYGVSFELRQAVVEPSAAAMACAARPYPTWCILRFAILAGQHSALFGVIALVTGILALLRGGRVLAIAAAALSMPAIVNFNVEMGVLALVFGLIAGVRMPRPERELLDGAPRA
ncbi:MAG TPA: hypothetical protein VKY65_09370 [Alphaproteobacteria bacterium]|nr:hypothetical protein [Alphaproteobacteria bacterium]